MPSVGIKNKNYLNVKNGPDPWMDAGGKRSKTDAKGHAVFSDPAYGIRAGLLQLRAYFVTHQLRTVAAMLSRWAPASDTIGSVAGNPHNNPTEYAAFVANRMGVPYDRPLELFRPDGTVDNVGQLRALFSAMAAYEIGDGFEVPAAELNAGLVHEGDRVVCGQAIARVGHLVGITVASDMLRFELYDKTSHGLLTTANADSKIAADGRPFMRRKDLQDPSPLLARLKDRLPATATAATTTATTTATPTAGVASPVAPRPTGFCIHIRRVRQEERQGMGFPRTVAEYRCYFDGAPIHDLEGQIVERNGPGDNTQVGVDEHRRIAAGTYPLAVQEGTNYKTYGYAATGTPLPGLALLDTGRRTFILIHPAHHAHGYLSSIGCLNPAGGLTSADSKINLADSRSRAIALIEGMKAKLGTRFPRTGPIPGAVVVIEGEPS